MKCKLCGSHEDVHEIYGTFDLAIHLCSRCLNRIANYSNNKTTTQCAIETLSLSGPWMPIRGFSRYEINSCGFVRVIVSGCFLSITLAKRDYGRYTLTDKHGERVSKWLSDLLYKHFNKRIPHVFHIYVAMRKMAREENQRKGINSHSRTYLRG